MIECKQVCTRHEQLFASIIRLPSEYKVHGCAHIDRFRVMYVVFLSLAYLRFCVFTSLPRANCSPHPVVMKPLSHSSLPCSRPIVPDFVSDQRWGHRLAPSRLRACGMRLAAQQSSLPVAIVGLDSGFWDRRAASVPLCGGGGIRSSLPGQAGISSCPSHPRRLCSRHSTPEPLARRESNGRDLSVRAAVSQSSSEHVQKRSTRGGHTSGEPKT